MNTFASHSIAAIAGAALVAGACAYNTLKKITAPSILAQPAKELKNAKTETLDRRPVIVYHDRVKRDLSLPEMAVKDPEKKVTASTKVSASDFPNTVTSVYDTGTGATDLYIRRDPLPWLAMTTRYELGIGYGSSDNGSVTRMDGSVELLQLKAIRLGLVGTLDSSGAYYGGGRLWVRW